MMKINDLNSELKLKKVPEPKDDPVAAETENAITPDAVEYHYEQQMIRLESEIRRQAALKKLADYDRKHKQSAV